MLSCFSHLSLRPYGLQPSRILFPWDSPGKSTGVCFPARLPGIFLTQGLNSHLLHLYSLAGRFFTTSAIWEVVLVMYTYTEHLTPNKHNMHSSQVHMEHYPGQTICYATKQVSINLKTFKAYKAAFPTTME